MPAAARVNRPTPPAQPSELQELILIHNAAVQAMRCEVRELRDNAIRRANLDSYGDFAAAKELIREWHATPDGIAFRKAVDAYNAQAAAWNAQLKADKTARTNAHEVAKVRAARCPACFTVKRTPDAPCINC